MVKELRDGREEILMPTLLYSLIITAVLPLLSCLNALAQDQPSEREEPKGFLEQPICKIGASLPDGWYVFAEDDADNWEELSCPRPSSLDDPHYNVWRTTPAGEDILYACRDTPLPKGYV